MHSFALASHDQGNVHCNLSLDTYHSPQQHTFFLSFDIYCILLLLRRMANAMSIASCLCAKPMAYFKVDE
jgi:hypothetical protein